LTRPHWPSIGVVGRIFAILLLVVVVEFAVSTLLYERASQLSVREDEARRVAEHLAIAREMLAEAPVPERPGLAKRISTDHFQVAWRVTMDAPPAVTSDLSEMRRQIIVWEPSLARSGLHIHLERPGHGDIAVGELRLPDGSWLTFRAHDLIAHDRFLLERILQGLVPAAALLLLGGLVVRQMLQPLHRLAQAAGEIGRGTRVHLDEAGTGEVRRVIHAFNEMQDRIHTLIDDRTQALAAVGHDLRTPLSRLELRADAIADPGLRHAIVTDVREMEAMVSSLLAYLGGEDDPEKPVNTDVAVLAATIADNAADRGQALEYEGPEHLETAVRPVGLKRALQNLVDNALHYGGSAVLSVAEQDGRVLFRVDDDGPGIAEEELAKVLSPFVRLDPARARNTEGLGLGLAIVTQAVAADEGRFTLANRPEGGLRAEISLPLR
jgi:two-component system osmolarity sensor histidine kinase EnvZ